MGEEVVEFGAAGGKVQVDVDSAEVRGEGAFEVGGAGGGGGRCLIGVVGWVVVLV